MTLEKLKELNNEQLNERFPFMICRNAFTGEVVKDEKGNVLNHFEDWGWRDIQLALVEHIKPVYDNFSDEEKNEFMIQQVKEKFGTLRTYWSSSNEVVDLWTQLAEYISSYTCIVCGKTLETVFYNDDNPDYPIKVFYYYKSKGWICPYCREHTDKDKEYNTVFAEDKFTFKRKIPYGPGLKITLKVDDFWRLEDD